MARRMNDKKPKICLFLGAGFSKSFGLPTMKEFIEEIWSKVTLPPAELSGIYQLILRASVFNDREVWSKIGEESLFGREKIKHISQKQDIESILGFLNRLETSELDNMIYLTTHTGFDEKRKSLYWERFSLRTPKGRVTRTLEEEDTRDAFRERVKKLRNCIKECIRESCWDAEKIEKGIAFCRSFFSFLYELFGNEIWVFTTNYDPVIEEYCEEESKIKLIDGFAQTAGIKRVWNPEEEFKKSPSGRVLKLVKLHGSCSWYYEKKGKIVHIPAQVKSLPRTKTPEPESSVIYPTQQKEVFARSPFRELFQLFQKVLFSEVNGCIIVGYSLRDDPIRRIFQEASEKIQLMIIDPKASEIAENFESKEKISLVNKELNEKEREEVQKDLIGFLNKAQRERIRDQYKK